MVASDYSSRRSAIIYLAQRKENDRDSRYGITHADIAKHLGITPTYARQYTSRLIKEGVLVKAPWTSPIGENIFTLPSSKELQKKAALIIAGNRVMALTNGEKVPTDEFIKMVTDNLDTAYTSQLLENADPKESPVYSWLIKRLMYLLGYEIYIDENGKPDFDAIKTSKDKVSRYRRQLETEMYAYRSMADMIETALNNPDTKEQRSEIYGFGI